MNSLLDNIRTRFYGYGTLEKNLKVLLEKGA